MTMYTNLTFKRLNTLLNKYNLHCDFSGGVYNMKKYVGYKIWSAKDRSYSLHIDTSLLTA